MPTSLTPGCGAVLAEGRRDHAGQAFLRSAALFSARINPCNQDRPVALERFGQIDSTLARKYEGTGLGLPLAKQLTELHGGTLTIESIVDVGTTVIVTLPAGRIVKQCATAMAAA